MKIKGGRLYLKVGDAKAKPIGNVVASEFALPLDIEMSKSWVDGFCRDLPPSDRSTSIVIHVHSLATRDKIIAFCEAAPRRRTKSTFTTPSDTWRRSGKRRAPRTGGPR